MTQSTFVPFGEYTESVRADQNSAPVLAGKLHTCAPPDLDRDEKAALADVVSEGETIKEIVSERERTSPAIVRPMWLAVVTAWSGVHDVASGRALLDESTKVGASARQILDTFFADGVPVAHRDANDTYAISSRLLERVDHEKLEKTFELAVGPEMVKHVRTTTETLGEALGVIGDRPAPVPSSTELQERLALFGRKVGRYCRLLAAEVDESDAQSVRRFLDAVKPIDDLRAARTAGGSDTTAPAPAPAPTNGAASTNGQPTHA